MAIFSDLNLISCQPGLIPKLSLHEITDFETNYYVICIGQIYNSCPKIHEVMCDNF